MKRFLLPIALVAVAAMSYSCAKTESTPAQEGQTLTFRIIREGTPADDASKALISETDDGRYVVFESGDKAGVIQLSGETATGTYGNITPDGTEATTNIYVSSSSSLAAETVLYFYYPYASKQTAYKAVPLNIPTYQSANSAGYDADAMPMAAPSLTLEEELTASTDETVTYYNLGSLIKFKVYSTNEDYLAESVKSVKFTAADGIAGDFTYDLSTVDGSTFTTPTLSETEIETSLDEVVSLSEASSKDNAAVLFMVVGVGSHSGTFTVTTDQAVYTYELSSAKTFQRSKCKNVSFDLANGTRTAQTLEKYKTVTELPYTNDLSSNNGYFVVEDQTNDDNITIWSFDASYGAKATAYVDGTRYATESYLVSPIFDVEANYIQLTFEHAGRYFSTPLSTYAKLLVRTVDGDTYGEWKELTIDNYFGNSSWTYVTATIDLSDYAGSAFQLAFDYSSTTSAAGTWEIKNFSMTEYTPSPEIVSVDPTEISYSADEVAGTEKTITVTTKNATSVSATVSDEDNFSVSVSDLADGVATVTVTNLNAAAESTVEATISITATDGTTTTNATTVAVSQAGSSVTYVTYTKITSTNDLTSGAKYLIVYEDGPLAFDGSLSADAKSNYKSVTISNSSISVAESDDTFYFTITASGTNYTVKAKSGSCIGNTSDANALNYGSSYTNTISFNDDGTVNIVNGGGSYLRYNATSGQTRFRYYKSSTYTGQKAIQLYKVSE